MLGFSPMMCTTKNWNKVFFLNRIFVKHMEYSINRSYYGYINRVLHTLFNFSTIPQDRVWNTEHWFPHRPQLRYISPYLKSDRTVIQTSDFTLSAFNHCVMELPSFSSLPNWKGKFDFCWLLWFKGSWFTTLGVRRMDSETGPCTRRARSDRRKNTPWQGVVLLAGGSFTMQGNSYIGLSLRWSQDE